MGNCNGNKQKVFPPFYTCFGATGPTGPTGPSGGESGPTGPTGAIGPTGPTERLFKSSNKIIIDSSLIIPYNEKKIIYFTIFPKKCHLLFFVTIFTIKLSNTFFIFSD